MRHSRRLSSNMLGIGSYDDDGDFPLKTRPSPDPGGDIILLVLIGTPRPDR